jgi:hypothetical protein
MSLADLLAEAYGVRMQLQSAGTKQWADVIAALVALPDATADLITQRAALAQVEARCVVSRVKREALDAAIAARG